MEDDQDHHRNPPPEMLWFCEECGKGFPSSQACASHRRIHNRPVEEDKNLERTLQPGPAPVRPSYRSTSLTLSLGDEHALAPVRPSYPSTSLTLSLGDEHAPAPVRPSYPSTSLTLSLGDEHGYQYPTGRNDLSAMKGLLEYLREIVKGSIPYVVTEYIREMDMNRGDQEDDKMNQGASDLQLFDKIPQPNREGPESSVNRKNKGKLDDESKDSEFFFDQTVGEPNASLNDSWWPLGYKAGTPLDWGTGGEGSSNDSRWQWGQYKASTPLDWGTGGEGSSNDNRWPWGQYKASTPLDCGTGGEGSSNATGGGGLIINDAEAEQHKSNRCWSCGSNFPTGQALGEHRCHHSTGSPAGNSSQGTGEGSRPVLDLDVKEPPPPPVEDSQVNAQPDSIPETD